jgi:hypothetical protein
MDKISCSQSGTELDPYVLYLLNKAKLPDELKEILKHHLGRDYFNYLKIVSQLTMDVSCVYFKIFKEKISRTEYIFNRFKIIIEASFRNNKLDFRIKKTILDEPLYSLVVEYTRKVLEEKGYRMYEEYVDESFGINYRIL